MKNVDLETSIGICLAPSGSATGLTNLGNVGTCEEETLMAVRLAYHANCWGPLGGNAVGVTSITQLTYRTFADMDRAFADIARAGYEGVEIFDGNLLDEAPAELRRKLSEAGLGLVSTYSGGNFIFHDVLPEELARIERVAAAAAEAGASHYVIGGGAKRVGGILADDYKRLAEALDRVGEIAKRAGLRAHYHPHLSTIVEGPSEVTRIFGLTTLDFCPDTAHLAAAGGDPAAQVRELAGRIGLVHLKGLQREPFGFTPLDAGDLDNGAVIQALKDTNYSGWVVAELDSWPDPQEGAARSHAFLKRHFA